MAKPAQHSNSFGAQLAPEPSDLETMMATEEPVEDFALFDETSTGDGNAANFASEWSSPEAIRAGRNHVQHILPPLRTLYDAKGESRSVLHSDVPLLVGTDIPPHVRLYIRCPKCNHLGNRGIHPFAGPNGCPGKPKRLWSACPICRSHGIEHRVYEEDAFEHAVIPDLEIDENYVAPKTPTAHERQDRLQRKLELHMVTFHSGEADQMFGIRRRDLNSGQSFTIETSGD